MAPVCGACIIDVVVFIVSVECPPCVNRLLSYFNDQGHYVQFDWPNFVAIQHFNNVVMIGTKDAK